MVLPLRTRWIHRCLTTVTVVAAVLLALPAAPAQAANRGLPEDLCQQDPPDADYEDREQIDEAHLDPVDCLTQLGVVEGYGSGEGIKYLPDADVFRGQMATFVSKGLDAAGVPLPGPSDQGFEDVDDDDAHADSIRRLAAAGIVEGVTDDRYAGHRQVTRAQMATFLVSATAYSASVQLQADVPDSDGAELSDLQGGDLPFEDVDETDTHGPSVAGAHELGVATGQSQTTYAPDEPVVRDAMASFIARMLDAVTQRTTVADRDTGAFTRSVFTFGSESGRCFQVKAGDIWTAECDPARSDDTLQLRLVPVGDNFTVVAGLVTGNVTRVEIEFGDGETVETALVPTSAGDLQAWSSPILQDDIDAVVAYDDGEEVTREQP